MFTGIVQQCALVTHVIRKPGLTSFCVRTPKSWGKNLKQGASVAIDGVCLTVTRINNHEIWFDAMEETLRKTTLGTLQKGQRVNLERSIAFGDEMGGHVVSGHVTGVARIIGVETPKNNHVVTFAIPAPWMKYIFPKGFIAFDGVSLTVVDVDLAHHTCTVHFIPETLRRTTFGFKRAGDLVNFEIDTKTQAIVDTIESQRVSAPRAEARRRNFQIAIVAGLFHKEKIGRMVVEAQRVAKKCKLKVVEVVWVPGSLEKPLALKRLLARDDIDGAVVLGIIERGETKHGLVMGQAVISAIIQLQLETGKPVGVGILGPEILPEQIKPRLNPYAEAAVRALDHMLKLDASP